MEMTILRLIQIDAIFIEEDAEMGREENIEVFEDTERIYKSNEYLVESIRKSILNEEFFHGKKNLSFDFDCTNKKKAKVIVSGKRTMEAAALYAYENKKVCVLNFASATNS